MAGNFYETDRAVSEYLLFHYATASEVLPYAFGPKEALNYPVRCVTECLEPAALPADARGLDLGCAVGRATFELARHCREVIGIDYSHRFIDTANRLKDAGAVDYTYAVEGELRAAATARLPEGVDASRVRFEQGDARNLRADLGVFDVVLAANLIDRLREPRLFLARLPELVKAGGQLILTSPYTWLEEYTPRDNWLGGFEQGGKPVRTFDTLNELLAPHFELKARKDLPFLIREHARKFQWSVAEATVWRRKS
ncbi:MAG: putative 4-mercaptohistidine N1-methyltransferase [Verrucomicrobiota bacterium]